MKGWRTRYLIGMVIDATGAGMYLPLSLLYFHHVTGLPIDEVGVLLTCGALFSLVGNPIAGTLVDRFGGRVVVVGGYLVRASGFAVYPFVHTAWAMFLAVALVAVGDGSFQPAIQSLIAEVSQGVTRDKLIGAQRSLRNAGLGAGGLIAAAALTLDSGSAYTAIVLGTGVAFVIAAAIIGSIPLPVGQRTKRVVVRGGYRTVWANKPFLALTGLNVPIAFGYMVLSVALPVYVTTKLGAPPGLVGTLYAVNTIGIALLQIPVTRVLVRFRRTRIVAAGAAVMGVSFVGYAMVGVASSSTAILLVGAFAATALFTLGELMHGATASALVASAAPADTRGRHLSMYQFSWAIPTAAAPAVLTFLLSLSASGMWLILAVGVGASAIMLLRLEPRLPTEAVRARTEPVVVPPARPPVPAA
jgi:MFS family permease